MENYNAYIKYSIANRIEISIEPSTNTFVQELEARTAVLLF